MIAFQSTDFDLEDVFFILFFVKLFDKIGDVAEGEGRYQYAAFAMLGQGAHMDPDAFPFGDVGYLGHLLFPAWRVGHLERVLAGGDEELGVLKGGYLQGVRVEREGEHASHGVAAQGLAD